MGGSLRVHRLVVVEDTDLAVDGLAEDPLSGVTRRRSCWNRIAEWSMVPDLAMGRSDVVVWGQESLYGFSTTCRTREYYVPSRPGRFDVGGVPVGD